MSGSSSQGKRFIAGGLTLIALTAAALLAARPTGHGATTPEACIDLMFEAAERGDVEQYLECFTGALRQRLENELRERGRAGFAEYLKSSVADVVGRALRQDLTEQLPDGRIRLVIERVYEGRPWERQGYRLVHEDGRWKVYHIEPAELFEPPVPYGTPAFPDEAPPLSDQRQQEP